MRRTVDENLYYRSIKKDLADHSRRDQTHGLPASQLLSTFSGEMESLPSPTSETRNEMSETKVEEGKGKESEKMNEGEDEGDVKQPPFLFRNANGLLNMTRQHNVSLVVL